MELFSELYSTYYHAVEQLLRRGSEGPLSMKDVQCILSENSFFESAYHILPKLQSGGWPLFKDTESGYSAVCAPPPESPLTHLQLAWLKAILSDPRIRLFFDKDEISGLKSALIDIPQLFYADDFYMFDRAADGDDYESAQYQLCFRVFLDAIHNRSAVSVQYEGGKGSRVNGLFWPYRLEYSGKDDKFRALCYRKLGRRKLQYVLNLGRVVSARAAEFRQADARTVHVVAPEARFREVTLDITKERNALERCMVQFAHFEKRTEYDAISDRYTCTVKYNVMDESELVIRVLSFGPAIRVLGPERFILEIRRRVDKQYELLRQHHDQNRG